MEVVITYLILCFLVATWTSSKGLSFIGSLPLALIVSPLLGGLIVVIRERKMASLDASAIA